MIEINCNQVSKRFQFEWIFKNFEYQFKQQNSYAVLGNNGSGKSTLLMLLTGFILPSSGKVLWKNRDSEIENDKWYKQLSLSSPSLELIEEFSLKEIIAFQKTFKPFINNISEQEIAEVIGLAHVGTKALKYYSSGMRQRVKITLAVMADTPVLFLDEPTTNLDEAGVKWYLSLIEKYCANKLLIVASNILREYEFCKHQIHMNDYK